MSRPTIEIHDSVELAMGIERALIATEHLPNPSSENLVMVIATEEHTAAVHKTLDLLRSNGIPAVAELSPGQMKKQFKEAARIGARFAVVIGEDEVASGKLTVKDMSNFEQTTLESLHAITHIRSLSK